MIQLTDIKRSRQMASCAINALFYGLYMDPEILKAKGIEARNPRKAVAKGYRLRVGKMATLLREENAEACGIVYELTHEEVNLLYWGAGLREYVAEAIVVETEEHEKLAVLCCNLLEPPAEDEYNPEYLGKLTKCMRKIGVQTPSA